MNAWDELVERCARRRREEIGPLSDDAYAELRLAVSANPTAFVDNASESALLILARALDAYHESCRNDDLLDDDAFEVERDRRLSALRAASEQACATDPESVDARLLALLAQDLGPDPLLAGLIELERDIGPGEPVEGDAWDDVFCRPRLRLRAAVARACLDGARYRMAQSAATSLLDAAPSDALGARRTLALAFARLEDADGFDALDARLNRHGDAWSHLARVILLFKLDSMSAARRALRGYDQLCEGGAYALLRPVLVEPYLPDRPETEPGSFDESVLAVREAEPIIADTPDLVSWCREFDWFTDSAERFARGRDLDW